MNIEFKNKWKNYFKIQSTKIIDIFSINYYQNRLDGSDVSYKFKFAAEICFLNFAVELKFFKTTITR